MSLHENELAHKNRFDTKGLALGDRGKIGLFIDKIKSTV